MLTLCRWLSRRRASEEDKVLTSSTSLIVESRQWRMHEPRSVSSVAVIGLYRMQCSVIKRFAFWRRSSEATTLNDINEHFIDFNLTLTVNKGMYILTCIIAILIIQIIIIVIIITTIILTTIFCSWSNIISWTQNLIQIIYSFVRFVFLHHVLYVTLK